jgi:electron transfer flavoprotein alpha subunit
MSILILAEHNNIEVKSSTLNTISAASKVGSEIDVLVVGSDIQNIAKEIADYQYVSKVISLDDKSFEHAIAEKLILLLFLLQKNILIFLHPQLPLEKMLCLGLL